MSKPIKTPDAAYLKARLLYIPSTGELIWKDHWSIPYKFMYRIGQQAGCITSQGYIQVNLDRVTYRAQRLIYKMMTGCDADGVIDHINRDRADNRWSNLRCVSHAENCANSNERSNKTSGLPVGVSKCCQLQKNGIIRCYYHATLKVNGVRVLNTSFRSIEAAKQAYDAAKQKYDIASGNLKV